MGNMDDTNNNGDDIGQEESEKDKQWVCPKCTLLNSGSKKRCQICHYSKKPRKKKSSTQSETSPFLQNESESSRRRPQQERRESRTKRDNSGLQSDLKSSPMPKDNQPKSSRRPRQEIREEDTRRETSGSGSPKRKTESSSRMQNRSENSAGSQSNETPKKKPTEPSPSQIDNRSGSRRNVRSKRKEENTKRENPGLQSNKMSTELRRDDHDGEYAKSDVLQHKNQDLTGRDLESREPVLSVFDREKIRRKSGSTKSFQRTESIARHRDRQNKRDQMDLGRNQFPLPSYEGKTKAPIKAEWKRGREVETLDQGDETHSLVDSEEEEEQLAYSILNLQMANAAMTNNSSRGENSSGRGSLNGSGRDGEAKEVKDEQTLQSLVLAKCKRIFPSSSALKKESIYLEEEGNIDHSEQVGFKQTSKDIDEKGAFKNESSRSLKKSSSNKFASLKSGLLPASKNKEDLKGIPESNEDMSGENASKTNSGLRSWKWTIIICAILLTTVLAISIPWLSKAAQQNWLTINGNSSLTNFPTPTPSNQPTNFWDATQTGGRLTFYNEIAHVEGNDIGDEAAQSLSMSPDGGFIAVGYPQKSVGPGKVQVFDVRSGDFVPLGEPIIGKKQGGMFGYSVSISDRGETVAVGAPAADNDSGYAVVYKFNSALSVWQRLGNFIDPVLNGYTGGSVSLSSDGYRLAVAFPKADDNDGMTIIYEYDNLRKLWSPLGQEIKGTLGELLGFSISLNKNGDKIAIGAVLSTGYESQQRGRVYVFQYVNKRWERLGSDLFGSDKFGRSVSLSANGERVAVGSTGFDEGLIENVGACEVYEYSEDSQIWERMGSALKGEKSGERNGFSVVLSGDGERLGCGGKGDSIVRIYERTDDDWEEIEEMLPTTHFTQFGTALGMNEDGNILAIKTLSENVRVQDGFQDGGDGEYGVVRLFQM